MDPSQFNRTFRAFSGAGILGGIYWFCLHTFFNPDWGVPGTTAYGQYELFNRLWTPGLLLIGLGYVGLYRLLLLQLSKSQRGGFKALFVGLGMMLVGNWAEFWLFSEQSYATGIGRNISWMTFLIGMFIMLLGALVIGLSSWHANLIPKWFCLLLILLLPLIFVGMWQQSGLLGNAAFSLAAMVAGGLGLWSNSRLFSVYQATG